MSAAADRKNLDIPGALIDMGLLLGVALGNGTFAGTANHFWRFTDNAGIAGSD